MVILQSVRCRVDWGWSTHSLAKQCNNNMLHTNTIISVTDIIWHFVLHMKQWTTLITKETVLSSFNTSTLAEKTRRKH